MADQADQAELVKQFTGIVSCSEQKARFYLEANSWELNAAISNYCEEPNAESTIVEPEVTASGSRDTGERTNSTTAPRSSFATLHDIDKELSEEDEEDKERENLYAGGEKSGIFMQNPNVKPTKPSNSLVSDILKKAAETGRGGHDEELEAATSASTGRSSFSGTGYKLGSEEEPSAVISDPNTSTTPAAEPPKVVRHITFWRNGFNIEDGPLMAYSDPANEEFLKAIKSGRAPLTFLNVRQDQRVDVRVAQRLDEDYKPPPKQPSKPFSGSGQRLGSPTPIVVTSSTPGAYPSTSSSSEPAPRARELEIDESLPITSIQIRLGDGTRMLSRFNHTHTVGDIRSFINASRVGEAQRNYILQTTFPPRDLKDERQTLLDASLLNSVVVQRYI